MQFAIPIVVMAFMHAPQETVDNAAAAEESNTPKKTPGLTDEQIDTLNLYDWFARVDGKRAIWVSVAEQKLRIIEGYKILLEDHCSTAEKGVGNKMNSLMTPDGWHSVYRKAGEDKPWGQVFRSRRPTNEIWKKGDDTEEDLVLTRILILQGEEEGKNKGGEVDSYKRNIYVHGTNDEERLGEPVSHGCVRLSNDNVIRAFDMVDTGTLLLITRE